MGLLPDVGLLEVEAEVLETGAGDEEEDDDDDDESTSEERVITSATARATRIRSARAMERQR